MSVFKDADHAKRHETLNFKNTVMLPKVRAICP